MLKFITTIVLSFSLFLVSCSNNVNGNGLIVTRPVKVKKDFKKIEINGFFKVTISDSDETSIKINTDQNLVNLVAFKRENDVLKIGLDWMATIKPSKGVFIDIKMPKLVQLVNNGSSEIALRDLREKKFVFRNNGSGDSLISGKVETLHLHNNGSGDIDAQYTVAQTVIVFNNGSGNITVHPIKELEGQINGSGSVNYLEKPQTLNVKSNGSGKFQLLPQ